MSYEEIVQKINEVINMIESTNNPPETYFKLWREEHFNYFVFEEEEEESRGVLNLDKDDLRRTFEKLDIEYTEIMLDRVNSFFNKLIRKDDGLTSGKQLHEDYLNSTIHDLGEYTLYSSSNFIQILRNLVPECKEDGKRGWKLTI